MSAKHAYNEKMKVIDAVLLEPAFLWYCPKCGSKNVEERVSLPTSEIDPKTVKRFKKANGLGPDDEVPDGTFYQHPVEVICGNVNCGLCVFSHTGELDDSDD